MNGHSFNKRTPDVTSGVLLLALLLFLVPISYTNRTYNPVIIKTVVVQGLLLLIFILILLLSIRNPHESFDHAKFSRFSKQNIIFLPILFYLAISVLSIIPSPYKYSGMKEISNLTTYILFFFATFYIINRDNIQKVLAVWSISTLLACVIGVLDFKYRRVANGSFGNPNLLAGYMVIALPVITGLLLANVNKVSKLLYITSIIAILFVLYLCKSRGAWLALAGGALTFLILLVLNNKKKLTMLILSIVVIGTIIFSLFLTPLTEALLLDVRPFIWRGTVKMIKAHPVIGSGIGTYLINYPDYRSREYFFYSHTLGKERGWQAQDVTDHAHSEYLEIASETGLIGLTAFFSIIVIFFVLIIKSLKKDEKSMERFILIGLASGVVSALIDNTVNISMRFVSSSLFFWFSMAASLAIVRAGISAFPRTFVCPCVSNFTQFLHSLVRHKTWRTPCPLAQKMPLKGKYACLNIGLFIVILLLGLIFYRTTCIDFRASACLMKGVKSRNNEDWQAAINYYKKAVSIDPYLLTAHYRLAFAYNEAGDLDKAIETYKNILEIAPHYAKTEANIGKVYMKKGMLDEALLYFKKAEVLNPYDIDLLCNIGSLYVRLGDINNTKCYVRRALTIEPGNEYASRIMRELK